MGKTEKDQDHDFPAGGEEWVNRKLYDVPLDALSIDPNQPRKHFDEATLEELKVSIDQHGVLQPIIFRKDDQDHLVIVSGERRYRASLQAQKQTIPAIFMKDGNATEIALVENLIRENLNPIEEAEALQKLKEEQNYTNEQLATVIGKAESTISEILSICRLPESIKTVCRSTGTVPRRVLVEIVKSGGDEVMEKLFEAYQRKELKGGDLRAIARKEKPPSKIWMKKIIDFSEKLEELNFETLGADRGVVEEGLKALNLSIQQKFA